MNCALSLTEGVGSAPEKVAYQLRFHNQAVTIDEPVLATRLFMSIAHGQSMNCC